MCNLSQGVFERGEALGIERGIKLGEARGEARGMHKGIAMSIKNLMEGTGLSFEAAADMLKVSQTDRAKCRELIEADS